MDKREVLSRYFGYTEFRGAQEELIDAALDRRDVLGIMPTGGGKSLCYQIPALMMPGLTLVISPLISLMQDQVLALKTAGIPAAYLNSSLSLEQQRLVFRNLRQGRYKILYAAPERLLGEGFLAMAREVPISLVAVDEVPPHAAPVEEAAEAAEAPAPETQEPAAGTEEPAEATEAQEEAGEDA